MDEVRSNNGKLVRIDEIVSATYYSVGSSKGYRMRPLSPNALSQSVPTEKNKEPHLFVCLENGESAGIDENVDQIKSILEAKDIFFQYAP